MKTLLSFAIALLALSANAQNSQINELATADLLYNLIELPENNVLLSGSHLPQEQPGLPMEVQFKQEIFRRNIEPRKESDTPLPLYSDLWREENWK